MRVIAGSAKKIQLKTLGGMSTRPTTDRIKETLFNMLAPQISGCAVLDLFAGSGGIGIEALSRGAERAVFVEKNRAAAAIIRENLARAHLEERAEVICGDALSAIRRLGGRKFDCIFMDPPYSEGLEAGALREILKAGILAEDGMVIVEAAAGTDFSFLPSLGCRLVREKRYKSNKHVFIKREGEL